MLHFRHKVLDAGPQRINGASQLRNHNKYNKGYHPKHKQYRKHQAERPCKFLRPSLPCCLLIRKQSLLQKMHRNIQYKSNCAAQQKRKYNPQPKAQSIQNKTILPQNNQYHNRKQNQAPDLLQILFVQIHKLPAFFH